MAEFDAAFFVDEFCEIDDTQGHGDGGGTMPFRLWPAQVGVLWDFMAHRLILILKARQLGISWVSCAYALWLALYHPGKVCLMFSMGQREANELLRRVKVLYERLPEWMQDALPEMVKNNTTLVEFSNGSRIESHPATQSAGRSLTASLVMLDEMAFLQYGTVLFTALKPVIDGGGQFIGLSTANGVGNLFHRVWTKAVKGLNKFHTIFIPWYVRPSRTAQWYRDMVAEADDLAKVAQEYPANAQEAFVSSGRSRFLGAWITRLAERLERLHERGEKKPLENHQLPALLQNLPGLQVYELAKLGCRYVLSGDVASGKEKGDFNAAVMLEIVPLNLWQRLFGKKKYRRRQVASMHGKWEPDTFGDYLVQLALCYDAELVVERNNQGLTTLSAIRRSNGGKGYRKLVCDYQGVPGWWTDKASKAQIINSLAQALRDDALEIYDPATLDELQVFSFLKDGSTGALPGYHDDKVMALAIGDHIAQQPPADENHAEEYEEEYGGISEF